MAFGGALGPPAQGPMLLCDPLLACLDQRCQRGSLLLVVADVSTASRVYEQGM